MKILITGCCGFIGFNFANYKEEDNTNLATQIQDPLKT